MNPSLSDLMEMDRAGLARLWQELFGIPVPERVRVDLLRQILGWQLQARREGNLNRREERRLQQGGDTQSLAVGSRLIRVWRGETHQVTVLEAGFDYAGKTYRSLSAIARAITGTPWSGYVFFGIKNGR